MINLKKSMMLIGFMISLSMCSTTQAAAFQLPSPHYQGQQVSLNFQDINIRSLLQLLAELAGLNMIASNTVTGSLTLHLDHVPWDQALDTILQSQGLGKRQIGNVLLIAPVNELATHEKQVLEANQQIENLEPLQSDLIQINYGKAADIAVLLKSQSSNLLSTRGGVSVDDRTNTLWVQDIPQKIVEVHRLVHQLDIPVKQVLIEGRIVNVNCNFEEQLGVKFGVTDTHNLTGTLDSGNTMTAGNNPSEIPVAKRLNIDLPAQAISGANPASIGLALARLGRGTLLDLELSALESEGAGQVISSPRIITADQQAAQIQSGQEIPYQEATSSGATSIAFKNAVLSLNVTPQITPDGKVLLHIKVNQDKVSALVYNGVPSIDTREIETQVLVDDGETIVLGGIYETNNKNRVDRVPFFGSLPVVGGLFRHVGVSRIRTELLIFVTPRVIKPCYAKVAL